MDIKMKEVVVHECEDIAHEYEVPFSMKDCEAYAPLPNKP